jgi:hypothetical protein
MSALPDGPSAVQATRPFVDAWIDELRRATSVPPYRRESARRAIEWRERQVKRHRSRLAGGPALQTWDGAAGVGAEPMRFRWPQASRILRDLGPERRS